MVRPVGAKLRSLRVNPLSLREKGGIRARGRLGSGNKRYQDQGHDRQQLDQDVHGRAAGVLEGIAYGIADHRCRVRFAAFALALQVAMFDGFLGVVPSAAGAR